jgi:hypothetical protein
MSLHDITLPANTRILGDRIEADAPPFSGHVSGSSLLGPGPKGKNRVATRRAFK